MTTKEIPVLLLTGYLGSGKTTLVNHIPSDRQGVKFAVTVNNIGEVNIDADLIQRGGIIGRKNESLVALQNGCICYTLKMDLIKQIGEILRAERFDYVVIEASGICEPESIAQTIRSIPRMGGMYTKYGVCHLNCVTTVVDALRLRSGFSCDDDLTRKGIDNEGIESLIIRQIEFYSVILPNEVTEVRPEGLKRIRQIIHTLRPRAGMIKYNYADVDLKKIVHTEMFSFKHVATSAGWIRGIESQVTGEEGKEVHRHHNHREDEYQYEGHGHQHEEREHQHEGHSHHHHRHHEEGETEEYGISTFIYYRRPVFDIHKLDYFIITRRSRHIIHTKGVCCFSHNRDVSCLFEQAGTQKQLIKAGLWYATASEEDLIKLTRQEPELLRDQDRKYGDRMQKIVFIGQHMDKKQIIRDLDECLEE